MRKTFTYILKGIFCFVRLYLICIKASLNMQIIFKKQTIFSSLVSKSFLPPSVLAVLRGLELLPLDLLNLS